MEAFLSYSPHNMQGYGLERMRTLMEYLGNPQDKIKVAHIAGTSGKTSTSYFIRGLLESAGMKTGLTVSPHITAINERLQIGGEPLEAVRYVAYANEFLDLVRQMDIRPTYFELLVAMAYWVFAKERVDYAVVETGLGGLLDGTNVVSRADKVCVITDIGLDHTEILGDTVEAITAQKAGIIQPGNHVVVRQQDSDIFQAIEKAVKQQQATLTVVQDEWVPDSLPELQHHNWVLALATFRYLQARDGLGDLTRKQQEGVALQTPPGRWELYRYHDKTIILDGAHNPQKLQTLSESLHVTGHTSAAVMANLVKAPEQKIRQSLEIMKAFTSHLIVPEFKVGQDLKGRQSLSAAAFAELAKSVGMSDVEIEPDAQHALRLLLARPEKALIVTGSLYLVSRVRSDIRQLLADEI
jgi:dihydrofolate synthase/folylpolyglutamate synthase